MGTWSVSRLGAAAGIAFVVLNVIGGLIAGSPSASDDSPVKIVSFFEHHHRAVIVGALLTGIAAPLFVMLLAAFALRLRAAGQGPAAIAVFAFGFAGSTLGTASDAVYGSLARLGVEGDTGLAQGAYQLCGFLTGKAFWFAAALALVTALAGWRLLPQWYALTSVVAAVVLALGGISLRASGFLAPLGGMMFIAFIALLVWVLATCALLWREPAGVASAAV